MTTQVVTLPYSAAVHLLTQYVFSPVG